MDTKIIDTKLKDKVDELSSSTASSAKSITELKTCIDSAKNTADNAIRKLFSLANK